MDENKNQRDVVGEILNSLSSEDRHRLTEAFNDYVLRLLIGNLGSTDEIAYLVDRLASRSNDSKDGVLKKALNLYRFALDARDEGNRISVLSPEDEIVHEVVGIGQNPKATPPQKVAG